MHPVMHPCTHAPIYMLNQNKPKSNLEHRLALDLYSLEDLTVANIWTKQNKETPKTYIFLFMYKEKFNVHKQIN